MDCSELPRVAVVGSRRFKNYQLVKGLMEKIREDIGDFILICGMEKTGADGLGLRYAKEVGLTIEEFHPNWDDVEVPGALVKLNSYGKAYNARAGFDRNTEMAHACTHVVAFWDGKSPGTKHMLTLCKKLGKKMRVFLINTER